MTSNQSQFTVRRYLNLLSYPVNNSFSLINIVTISYFSQTGVPGFPARKRRDKRRIEHPFLDSRRITQAKALPVEAFFHWLEQHATIAGLSDIVDAV